MECKDALVNFTVSASDNCSLASLTATPPSGSYFALGTNVVNVVAADAGISSMYAKYHYLFWRPVTAIDPSSVEGGAGDGFGPNPGFSDGNAATPEVAGWRSLLPVPNHPEYPSAHGTLTSAVTESLVAFLGTNRIDVDIHGFDPNGAAGNLNAVHHFNRANDLLQRNAGNVVTTDGKSVCDPSKGGKSDDMVFIDDQGKATKIANPEQMKGMSGQKVKIKGEMRKIEGEDRVWVNNLEHISPG